MEAISKRAYHGKNHKYIIPPEHAVATADNDAEHGSDASQHRQRPQDADENRAAVRDIVNPRFDAIHGEWFRSSRSDAAFRSSQLICSRPIPISIDYSLVIRGEWGDSRTNTGRLCKRGREKSRTLCLQYPL